MSPNLKERVLVYFQLLTGHSTATIKGQSSGIAIQQQEQSLQQGQEQQQEQHHQQQQQEQPPPPPPQQQLQQLQQQLKQQQSQKKEPTRKHHREKQRHHQQKNQQPSASPDSSSWTLTRTAGGALVHFTKVDLTDSLRRPPASLNPYRTRSFSPLSGGAHGLGDITVTASQHQRQQQQQQQKPKSKQQELDQQQIVETRENVHALPAERKSKSKKKKQQQKNRALLTVTDPNHGSQQSTNGGDVLSGLVSSGEKSPSQQPQPQQRRQSEPRTQSSEEEATSLSQLRPGQRVDTKELATADSESRSICTSDLSLEQIDSQQDEDEFWSDQRAVEYDDSQEQQDLAQHGHLDPTIDWETSPSLPQPPPCANQAGFSDSIRKEPDMDKSPVSAVGQTVEALNPADQALDSEVQKQLQNNETGELLDLRSPSSETVQSTPMATVPTPQKSRHSSMPSSSMMPSQHQSVVLVQSNQGSTPAEQNPSQARRSSVVTVELVSSSRQSLPQSHPTLKEDPLESRREILECVAIPIVRQSLTVAPKNSKGVLVHVDGPSVAAKNRKRKVRDSTLSVGYDSNQSVWEEEDESHGAPVSTRKKHRIEEDSPYSEPTSRASWESNSTFADKEEEEEEEEDEDHWDIKKDSTSDEELEAMLGERRSSRLRAQSHHTTLYWSLRPNRSRQRNMDSPSKNTRSSRVVPATSPTPFSHQGLSEMDEHDNYRPHKRTAKGSTMTNTVLCDNTGDGSDSPVIDPLPSFSVGHDLDHSFHDVYQEQKQEQEQEQEQERDQDQDQDVDQDVDYPDVARLRAVWQQHKFTWPLQRQEKNRQFVVQSYSPDFIFGTALPLPYAKK